MLTHVWAKVMNDSLSGDFDGQEVEYEEDVVTDRNLQEQEGTLGNCVGNSDPFCQAVGPPRRRYSTAVRRRLQVPSATDNVMTCSPGVVNTGWPSDYLSTWSTTTGATTITIEDGRGKPEHVGGRDQCWIAAQKAEIGAIGILWVVETGFCRAIQNVGPLSDPWLDTYPEFQFNTYLCKPTTACSLCPPTWKCQSGVCQQQCDASEVSVDEAKCSSLRHCRWFRGGCVEAWKTITCPVMGALVKNGDLRPDENGFVSKEQVFETFLFVGISASTARQTTEDNFNHLITPNQSNPEINIFEMNTIVDDVTAPPRNQSPAGALEHFRSTGVTDDVRRNERFALIIDENGEDGFCADEIKVNGVINHAVMRCISGIWDAECRPNDDSSTCRSRETNDVNEFKRPTVEGRVCGIGRNGRSECPSQLHGALDFMHMEFCSPTGIRARCGLQEFKLLWLEGIYPRDFDERSPRKCRDPASTHYGCQKCLDSARYDKRESLATQRYCRCMLATLLSQHWLEQIPEYIEAGCPAEQGIVPLPNGSNFFTYGNDSRCFRFASVASCKNISSDPESVFPDDWRRLSTDSQSSILNASGRRLESYESYWSVSKQSCEPYCLATGKFAAGCCKLIDPANLTYVYGPCDDAAVNNQVCVDNPNRRRSFSCATYLEKGVCDMILTSRRRIYAGEAKDHCAGTCGVCPTQMPTVSPTPQPTEDTTMEPTEAPLTSTTPQPIDDTTMEPTEAPTENPISTTATPEPTAVATPYPSMVPTSEPTEARPCIGIKWKGTKCARSCGNARKCNKKCATHCSQSCVCNLPSTTATQVTTTTTPCRDEPARRRVGYHCQLFETNGLHCYHAKSSRRRQLGGEAKDTCKLTCNLCDTEAPTIEPTPPPTEAKSCASMGKGWNDKKCNAQCTRLRNCPKACRKKCSSGCTCNASRRLIQAPDEYGSGKFV